MAGIPINTQFELGAAVPIDSRLVLTKAQMLAINDNTMPNVYGAWCSDDGKAYIYNKSNTPSLTTGKFVESNNEFTQVTELPLASEDELGKVYQYIGDTDTYTKGLFYICTYDELEDKYSWEYLPTDNIGSISNAEIDEIFERL